MGSSNPQYLGKFQRGAVAAGHYPEGPQAEEREPYRASSKRSKRLGANPRRLINESLRRQDADQEIRNLGRW
ncbi:MAG TPA: hypothetical protein H9903_02745 [Candidatus Aquabacterium excrementipullorum]|nr:hypothetical protein [Candidatus Aquabacterium excrementipullorum]